MIGWRLRWKAQCRGGPPGWIHADVLRPEVLCTLSMDEVADTRLVVGARNTRLGDLFEIQTLPGEVGLPRLQVDGSPRFLYLGCGMESGALEVEGDAGMLAGAGLKGGTLRIRGRAGHLAGAGMIGGLLRIDGDAGDRLGGPLPGGSRGLAGGEILVTGKAGDDTGLHQRGGLLVAALGTGRHPGRQMHGGTLLVLQGPLLLPALDAHGGSILGPLSRERLPAGFRRNGPVRLVWLRILKRRLNELELQVPEDALRFLDAEEPLEMWNGDLLSEGRGEVLVQSG